MTALVLLDPAGTAVKAVDVHAHHFGAEVMGPHGSPRLVFDDAGQASIARGVEEDGGRPVPAALWSVERRLAEMDRGGVSHQVISPVPAVMEHAWGAAPEYARLVNASMAAACDASGGRLIGLGCISQQGWPSELKQCVALGLCGVEVGTRQGDLDLDASELTGLWRACEDGNLCVFVHPVAGGRGVLRRSELRLDVGLGMLTDTAIAASSLVFGGVLAGHPRLRVALAHGGGAFPWVFPRLRDVAGTDRTDAAHRNKLARRLYVDTLVLDVEHVRVLVHHFGQERLVLGSDCPYLPAELAHLVAGLDHAVEVGAIAEAAAQGVLVNNALGFLGLTGWRTRTRDISPEATLSEASIES